MKRKYLDKWIGTVTCQNILEALENDITEKKKLFANIQLRRFCNGRHWMLVAFRTILWKFLDENNYANKNDQRKFEGKNGYYHISTLENARV